MSLPRYNSSMIGSIREWRYCISVVMGCRDRKKITFYLRLKLERPKAWLEGDWLKYSLETVHLN